MFIVGTFHIINYNYEHMRNTLLLLLAIAWVGMNTSMAQAPVIDGDMSDPGYVTIGTFTSGNGFAGDNDLGELKAFWDGSNLYLGLTGELNADNRMVLLLDFSGYGGATANAALPGSGGFANGYAGTILPNEVDFILVGNEGNGTTDFFVDAGRYGIGSVLNEGYLGNSNQAGTIKTITAADLNSALGGSTGTDGEFAYQSNFAGDANEGWEIKIPLDALPGVSTADDLSVLAGISNGVGFWSDEFIPSVSGSTGNPGSGADLVTFGVTFTSPQAFATTFPVELLSFQAKAQDERVQLNWLTANEVNHSHFEIERSADAQDWAMLERIQTASKRSDDQNSYQFTDLSPMPGRTFYRLRQVDLDGTSTLSPQVEVTIAPQGQLIASPNPVQDRLTLELPFAEGELQQVLIYNLQGRPVARPQAEVVGGSAFLDVSDLPAGLYQVQVKGTAGQWITRIRKQ